MKADIETLSDAQQKLVRFMNYHRCSIFQSYGTSGMAYFSQKYVNAWYMTNRRIPSTTTLKALRDKGVLVKADSVDNAIWNSTAYTLADDWKD